MNDNQRIVLSWLKEKWPDGTTPFENIYNLINETWSVDIDADENFMKQLRLLRIKKYFKFLQWLPSGG